MSPLPMRSVWVLSVAVLLATPSGQVRAQQSGSVTGQVTASQTQRPLGGVQVHIPGTGIGSLTNADGRFLLINVPVGSHTVRAQLLGFGAAEQSVSVAAGATATASFQLQESAIALDEVVVTGAGQATERRKLGNTVGTINAAQLENAPIVSAAEVLQARTPGVTISQGGGSAGEASSIRIRGSASLSQQNEPIIYVDGIRIDNSFGYGTNGTSSRLDDIDPTSIERVEVLKGAAAATLYGTEASNGVIQIFTKKGSNGAPRWTLESSVGISKLDESRYPDLAGFALKDDPTPGRDTGTRGIQERWGVDVQPYEVFSVSLLDLIAETGHFQNYNLSVAGGSDAVTYYVSGRYTWEDGIMGGTQFGPLRDQDRQTQLNANMTIVPAENLRLEVSTRYTDRDHRPNQDGTPSSPVSITILAKPEYASSNNLAGWRAFGTISEAMQIEMLENTKRFGGALTANYSLTPQLTLQGTAGLDITSQLGSEFRRYGYNVNGVTNVSPDGYRQVVALDHSETTFEGRVAWNTDLGEQLSSALVLGGQVLVGDNHRNESVGERFPGPGLEVTTAGAIQRTTEEILKTVSAGLYAQEQVGFRNYFFLTAGARFDNHSAFGQNAGGALYPKVSFSFVPSSMPGWDGLGAVSTLRFRGALGQSGLQPGAFDQYTTYAPVPSEAGPGLRPENLGNPDLEPEVSTEWEAGFEAGLFDNRFAFDFTYWNRTVSDLLVERLYQPSGGFLERQLDNIGEMKAQGVEFGVNGLVYGGRTFSINAFANAAYLTEEVTDLGGAPPIKVGGTRQLGWIREGYAPGAYFGGKLVDAEYPISIERDGTLSTTEEMLAYFAVPRTPEQVQTVLLGEKMDGDLLGHYLGKPVPDWTGTFGGEVAFLGNFSLNTMFEYRGGNFTLTDHTGGFRRSHPSIGRNTVEAAQIESTLLNPASTAQQRLDAAKRYAEIGAALDQFNGLNQAFAGDFLRWRELSLTYRVSGAFARRIGADGITLTAAGRNLMLWTDYPGMDPENTTSVDSGITLGHDAHKLGIPRRFSFSARISF